MLMHVSLLYIYRVPGGSAANVMKGLANISGGRVHCKFMGMVGTDAVAQDYMQKLKEQNVQPVLLVSSQRLQCTEGAAAGDRVDWRCPCPVAQTFSAAPVQG